MSTGKLLVQLCTDTCAAVMNGCRSCGIVVTVNAHRKSCLPVFLNRFPFPEGFIEANCLPNYAIDTRFSVTVAAKSAVVFLISLQVSVSVANYFGLS